MYAANMQSETITIRTAWLSCPGEFKLRGISFEFSAQKNCCFFSIKYTSDNLQKSFPFTFLLLNPRQQNI